MEQVGVKNLEDLSGTTLSQADRQELLAQQSECTFVFAGEGGWPSGVVMSFLEADGRIWLTSVEGRVQTRGVASDSRASIIVSSIGTDLPGRRMLALRGNVTVHRDDATKQWFYPRFAKKLRPQGPDAFVRLLDSAKRVIFEFSPVAAVSHNSRKIAGDGRGGPAPA